MLDIEMANLILDPPGRKLKIDSLCFWSKGPVRTRGHVSWV